MNSIPDPLAQPELNDNDLPAYLFAKPTITRGAGRKGHHRRTKSSMPDELN